MPFADKPVLADIAVNDKLTGTDPVLCIPLVEAALDAGLEDIGTGGRDASWDTNADDPTINYSALEGGGVEIDFSDTWGQRIFLPIPGAADTYAVGTKFWRLQIGASLPTSPALDVFASSGRGTAGPPGAGQYAVQISETSVDLLFRPEGSTEATYSVLHSASGVTAGSIVDVVFSWGTGGVQFYVNGVASGNNDPAETGAVIIRDAAQNGTGEVFGNYGVFSLAQSPRAVTMTLLDWDQWSDELTPTEVASLREDPHWPMRQVLALDTLLPQLSIESDAEELNLAVVASANAPAIDIDVDGTGVIQQAAASIGNSASPTRGKIVLDRADPTADATFSVTYTLTALGNVAYYLYAESMTTGKASGTPLSFTIPAVSTSLRLLGRGDRHSNQGDTFSDFLGDAGGLDDGYTEAQLVATEDEITAGMASEGGQMLYDSGDCTESCGTYSQSSQAAIYAALRVERNKRVPASLAHLPMVMAVGNHDAIDDTTDVGGTPAGTLMRSAIDVYRLNPPGAVTAQHEDHGGFEYGPCAFYLMNAYGENATFGDDEEATVFAAAMTYLGNSSKAHKVLLCHKLPNSTGTGRGSISAMEAPRLTALRNAGVTAVILGHNHNFVHDIDNGGDVPIHFIEIGGEPSHIGGTFDGGNYDGILFGGHFYGYAVIDFFASGNTTVKFVKTREWNDAIPGVALAAPQVAYDTATRAGLSPRVGIGIGVGV